MYEKVQYHLKEEIKSLRRLVAKESAPDQKKRYLRAIVFMEETRMAVVISLEGSEKEEQKKFAKQGIDIVPHRKLLEYPDEDGRNIEDYFKDPNNTYRIVFVTAMWLTGFDAPTVSTLYLDKPMQNHTLMQTIARANRVFEGKKNGIVIDYFGVFRNLKKALAAEGSKGKKDDGDGLDEYPVKEFEVLLKLLEEAIAEAKVFCQGIGADIDVILEVGEKGFKEVELFNDYANAILEKKEYRTQFGLYVNTISSLYDSAKPEVYGFSDIKKLRDVFEYLRMIVERNVDQDEQVERAKEQRAAREGMTEEELEIFDLLKKDKLTIKEKEKVKLAAQSLLKKLKDAKDTVLIQAWHKKFRSQERVRREIQLVLSDTLPKSYDLDLFVQKTDVVFQHLYNQAELGATA